jgi:hypothetical protein
MDIIKICGDFLSLGKSFHPDMLRGDNSGMRNTAKILQNHLGASSQKQNIAPAGQFKV